jgi:hypothetical protein
MQPNRNPANRTVKLVAVGLAICTLAVFGLLGGCEFTNFDDSFYVTRNPQIMEGLSASGAWWALTTTYNSNWHPLTWLSLQLDYQVYGLNPVGYHITNLLLHTANVVLLFWVLRGMTGAAAPSALVAGLFAVHPLHVESVAWIAERKDVLSTLFWMLTLAAYLRYVERPSIWRYGGLAVALALGLLAKPMLVTLPFVLLLLDYWPLRRLAPFGPRRFGPLLAEKLPLLVLAGASCAITLIAQHQGAAVRPLEDLPLASRAANGLAAYATYLLQAFWPLDLAAFYPYVDLAWSDARMWGAGLLLAGITAVAILQRARRPYLLVGWLWYLGTLVPVIGLVQVGSQAHADRYTYVPLIGVFVMIAWAVAELVGRGGLVRWLALAFTAAALVGCVVLTWRQVSYWHDSTTLWAHTIAVTGPNARAHFGLGAAFRDLGWLRAGAEEFRRALAINPRYDAARSNLGWCLLLQGRLEEADAELHRILQSNPDDANAHFQLGVSASLRNRPAVAVAHFRQALRLRPDDPVVHLSLAHELIKQGNSEAARRHLREAERCDPRVRALPAFQAALRAADEGQAHP